MQYISKNKQSFGVVAKDYKKFRGTYNTDLYEFLFSYIKKNISSVSILDLGCGVGNSTEPIVTMAKRQKRDVSVFGCDPDRLMLREARLSAKKNHLSIKYLEGSAERLPFQKGSFDVIISGAAFHWFATKKAMKNIQRILKKNGIYFVFWTQNMKSGAPTIGQDLYKKYGWRGIPKKLRDPKQVKKIFLTSGFLKVKTVKIPHVEVRTISETIGLIKTNSTYALLSGQDKKDFIREMTRAYQKALKGRKDITKQDIHICYGVK